MGDIWSGVSEAFRLLAGFDSEVVRIILLSLAVSGAALAISSILAIPVGVWLAYHRFFTRRLVIAALYTGVGFPPVVIGLLVYLVLSRTGPLGWLDWLYSAKAMILAQVMISFPVIAALTMSAMMGVNPTVRRQAQTLGATDIQSLRLTIREARVGVTVAVVAGFGSIISEVGAVMMVGGNLKGSTQVLTTAIVQSTLMGSFDLAIALAVILLALSFLVSVVWIALQGSRLVES